MSKGIADRCLRRIALVAMLAVFSVLHVGLAEAESGQVSLELKYIGFGLGYHTGTATVTVGGEVADYKVSGTQLMGIGFSSFVASGTVTGAASIDEIGGKYTATKGSVAAIVGGVTLTLTSHNDIKMNLTSNQSTGFDLSAGLGELTFSRVGGVRQVPETAAVP